MEDKDYQEFIRLIYRKSGIDLSQYKEAQMKRRLTSLRNKREFPTFVQFFHALDRDATLYYEFLDKMTINVSEFYRNDGRWQVLQNKILPKLVQKTGRLQCWSAACSTGEEPYTLLLILKQLGYDRNASILATDIDENAIARAKIGLYNERAIQGIPTPLLQRYFRKEGEFYAISDEIKNRIQFKRHNLLADPYGSGYDLIICRNVMIYFTEEAKDQIYAKFSQALRPGGILFVGSTEQIFQPQRYQFVTEDTFFYRKME
ncbi:CheR family methyltransferase [Rubeoparvulum massiliense]|uniref:CheR family methyltransferase n=1 Tax=Rubeoparvulum massiliense TaxID=1631346 RepID=UPI00065E07A5|nr:protein-glutamate O-methyltransferase CheR [Rubeoparvulum massiliense]